MYSGSFTNFTLLFHFKDITDYSCSLCKQGNRLFLTQSKVLGPTLERQVRELKFVF